MPGTRTSFVMTIDEITENFEILDEGDDRYRYVIELGRMLPTFSEAARTEANKDQGCASHIGRGLIAILFAMYSGKPAQEMLRLDALGLFDRLGLREHLTPQRSN